jgi:peptide/nickel transport system substrate-binding protein
MQRSAPVFLAVASLLTLSGGLEAARPRYGGTLRLQTQGTLRVVDPTAVPANGSDAAAARHVVPLVFETLIRMDSAGGLKPLLASSWQTEAGGTRWRVQLRAGPTLHDGAALEPSQVADALRAGHSGWLVTTDQNTLVVDAGREHDAHRVN